MASGEVSSDGLLNVPEGRYKNAQNIYQPDILEDCSQQLSAATIKHQSFKESFEEVKNGDLVYIDHRTSPSTSRIMSSHLTIQMASRFKTKETSLKKQPKLSKEELASLLRTTTMQL